MSTTKIEDAILGYLVAEGGSTSPSYLKMCLKDDGWRVPSRMADFEDFVSGLGFTIEPRLRKDGTPARSGRVVTL